MSALASKLAEFAEENAVRGKGPLSVMLVLTRKMSVGAPPYSPECFLTRSKGQVAGLSSTLVQSILGDHGVSRVLAEEAGRTSRGSIEKMTAYVSLINDLASANLLDFRAIEEWWVERVRAHFATEPLKLKADLSKSLRSIVAELIATAFERQRECRGTMVAGAVLQHLVGAKLELAIPSVTIEHHGFSVADAPNMRKGDFVIGDSAIHVTTAPSEALLRKCSDNLAAGLRPIIITTSDGTGGAHALAKNHDLADRIEILDIEQFITTNVLEWSTFQSGQRQVSVSDLIERYNVVVDVCETDPSLRIATA